MSPTTVCLIQSRDGLLYTRRLAKLKEVLRDRDESFYEHTEPILREWYVALVTAPVFLSSLSWLWWMLLCLYELPFYHWILAAFWLAAVAKIVRVRANIDTSVIGLNIPRHLLLRSEKIVIVGHVGFLQLTEAAIRAEIPEPIRIEIYDCS